MIERNQAKVRGGSSAWIPLVVVVLGLSITTWAVLLELDRVTESDQQRFSTLSERLQAEISRRLGVYRSGLIGMRSLFVASQEVRRGEFRSAVTSHDLAAEFPGALGIGFIRPVSRAHADAFVDRTRADEAPEFQLRTKGTHDPMMVIDFIEPAELNRTAAGFDISQEHMRREAAERSLRTGEATLTRKITLVQATHSGPGFLYLLPVYREGLPLETLAERGAALSGWVYMPIVAERVFRGAADVTEGALDFEVFEGPEPALEQLIYDDDRHVRDFGIAHLETRALWSTRIAEIGGQHWTVTMSTTPRFRAQKSTQAWILGCAGCALSVLLGLLVRTQRSAMRRAEALAQSMVADVRRLAMVAERSTNGVVITDAKRRITWVNRGFTRITGQRLEDVRAKDIADTIVTSEESEAAARFSAALAAAGAFRGELGRFGAAGDLRSLDADVQPLRDTDGDLLGFVSVETDVTDNVRAKLELKASQDKLQLLLDSTGEAIYGVDTEGRFAFCNRACVRQLGYAKPEDLLGRHSHSTIHHSRPDGAEYPVESCPVFRAVSTGEPCQVRNEIYFRADRSSFSVEYSAYPQRHEGQIVGAVVVFTDITERKQLEAQNERAAKQLEVTNAALEEAQAIGRHGNWRLDLATGRMEWSKQLFHLFEQSTLGPAPSLEGWQSMFTEEDAARHAALVETAISDRAGYRVVLRTRDREVRFVRVEGRTRSDGGRVTELYGTAADVTDEVEREESLRVAQRRAEDASRSKSEFLANMSHEIRTPMTAILGYADLLSEDGAGAPTPEQRREYCDTIKRNGEHLLAIINDVLDISKIEAGMLAVERVETSTEELVEDVIDTMTVKAQAKGLQLNYHARTPVPARVRTDPIRLRQILINLVGNAVKFTEVGGVDIETSFEALPSPVLRFDITDTGIGLTPEQGAGLFRAFQQADSSTTRRFGGTGLGLHISKRLAEMLGGDISFRSELGRGSTFSVTIDPGPVSELTNIQKVSALPAVTIANPPSNSNGQELSGARILIAEDGQDNQRIIAFHLRKAGAHVQVVDNGKLMVERLTDDGTVSGRLANALPVDVIVTDMQMPELDGYAATRLLRGKGCRLPIIALTAHAMSADADKCYAAGCDAYMTKPVDRDTLVGTCRAAVAGELVSLATLPAAAEGGGA